MGKGRVYKVVIHNNWKDSTKVSILEYDINKITDKNYILDLGNNETRRIPINTLLRVTAERGYTFDLNTVDEVVEKIVELNKMLLQHKIDQAVKEIKHLNTVVIDRDVKTVAYYN